MSWVSILWPSFIVALSMKFGSSENDSNRHLPGTVADKRFLLCREDNHFMRLARLARCAPNLVSWSERLWSDQS
jgi:hypothetical protein